MKLSIIVPLYKVELYIKRCIESLLNQDIEYNDYEIIVVDDGSPDLSASIVEGLQNKYNNIYLFHKPNGGLSSARNYGLSKARGKYIWFVDSDDWIENNCLSYLFRVIDTNKLDCIWFNHQQVFENNNKTKKIINSHQNSQNIYDGKEFLTEVFGSSCYACMFWFRREWLIDNSFIFKEGILYEDLEAIPRLLLNAKRIKYENTIVYNYYIRKESIVNAYNSKKISSLITAIDTNVKIYKLGNKSALEKIITNSIIGLLRLGSNSIYEKDRRIIINYLDSINLKLNYNYGHFGEVLLYNISYKLLICLYCIIRRLY